MTLSAKINPEKDRIHGTCPKARYCVAKCQTLKKPVVLSHTHPFCVIPFEPPPRTTFLMKELATFLMTKHLVLSRHYHLASYRTPLPPMGISSVVDPNSNQKKRPPDIIFPLTEGFRVRKLEIDWKKRVSTSNVLMPTPHRPNPSPSVAILGLPSK